MEKPKKFLKHSAVLSRHLYSVGIGDVFVKPPSHPLPIAYLANSREMKDNTTTAACDKGLLSREIVGIIKQHPKDFIVREIALPNRTIPGLSPEVIERTRVASIEHTYDTATCDTSAPGPDFSSLDDRISLAKRRKYETTASSSETVNKTLPQQEGALAVSSDTKASDSSSGNKISGDMTPRTPLEVLKTVLQQTLGESQEHGDRNADQVIDSIRQLQMDLQESIRQLSESKQDLEETKAALGDIAANIGHVMIPPLQTTVSKERGEFHRSVRKVFPLLQSESVINSSDSTKEAVENVGYKVKISPDPLFFGIIPYLYEPHVDLLSLYKYYRCSYVVDNATSPPPQPLLRLRPDLERKHRGAVHKTIFNLSRKMLMTNTISSFPLSTQSTSTTCAISVEFSRNAQSLAKRKRARFEGKEVARPISLVVVRKCQKDHSAAHRALVSVFRCSKSSVTFAGMKDLQAITEQFFTIIDRAPQQIQEAAEALQSRGIEIGQAVAVPKLLEVGGLAGNRFEIVVRNIQRILVDYDADGLPFETRVACNHNHVDDCVERVRKYGFVNFFGEQRVGIAGDRGATGPRAFEIGRALFQENFSEAIDLIMEGREVRNDVDADEDKEKELEGIRRARASWIQEGRNPYTTAKLLPNHAHLASERLLMNNLKRVDGDARLAFDLVPKHDQSFWTSAYQSYLWNLLATERVRLYGSERAVAGDLILSSGSETPYILEDDSEKIGIEKVCLPLPGHHTLFPSNKVGQFLREKLEFEGINIGSVNRKGSYRYLISPTTNLQHNVFEEDGVVNLKVQFDLPSGSFATMALREFMTSTVTRDSSI